MKVFVSLPAFTFAAGFLLFAGSLLGASSTLIDNASDPDRAQITFPDYKISPQGKWTIVVVNGKSLRFRSLDGTQNMQAGTIDLHPKPKESEGDAFRNYVSDRRELERVNIENKALSSDPVGFASDTRGQLASWCIIDPAGLSGHLTAILMSKRKLLIVSYDVDKIGETEFRKRAEMVTGSMSIR